MIVDDRWLEITKAVVSYLAGNSDVAARSFVRIELDKSLVKHPRYPAQPLVECPFVVVRAEGCVQKDLVSFGAVWEQTIGVWIYRSKPLSGEPQEAIMQDLKVVSGSLKATRNPATICAAGAENLEISGKLLHDELHHPYDDPRLRVLCGEIALKITARKT